MLAALERWMPRGTTWTTPRGGFFSWLTLPGGVDVGRPRAARGRAGRRDRPRRRCSTPDGRGADKVRLSFSMVDEAQIDEGIELLASLVRNGG